MYNRQYSDFQDFNIFTVLQNICHFVLTVFLTTDHRVVVVIFCFRGIFSRGKLISYGKPVGYNLIHSNRRDIQSVIIINIKTEGHVLFKDPVRNME
jgi:hypothetical protein